MMAASTTDPAFYRKVGPDEFESTPATASPWDEQMQHGGPPAGLLARAIEQTRPDPDMPIARLTSDMLGPIPQGRVRVTARVVRPGRRVEMVEASLWAGGQLAVTATAWRIRAERGRSPARTHLAAPPTLPPAQPQVYFPGVSRTWGYGRAVEWRFVEGSYAEPGPGSVWARVRIPLVEGEDTSPIPRLAIVVDSTNGISGELPIADWLFVPPTLSLTVLRPPVGPWIHLAAQTHLSGIGTGVAQANVSDPDGLVAVVSQPLLVAPRT
ncbi:thioesterase family protein [Intrasporangium sp.]|uniref:thioesterase family protein n=1 Tax=Intrasporangium sp. TaxID=1925024 RepID=UPI0032220149